jgi:hypothetical protein
MQVWFDIGQDSINKFDEALIEKHLTGRTVIPSAAHPGYRKQFLNYVLQLS